MKKWGEKERKRKRTSETRCSQNRLAWKVENKMRDTIRSRHFINCNLKIQGH